MSIAVFGQQHPEVVVVLAFLLAVAAHVVTGALVHLLRRKDWDWNKLGLFVEDDLASTRARVIGVAFIFTLAATAIPSGDWHAAFIPAFATLAATSSAATLPILQDTGRELLELVTGIRSVPAHLRAGTPNAVQPRV